MIEAALELVAESEADDVTLRAVARRAGVSAGAPYHHFPDKDALLAAVARDGFESLARIQLEIAGGGGSAPDRLERLATAYVLFAWNHQTHYGLMFKTLPTDVVGTEAGALREAALQAFGRLVDAIRAANPDLADDESTARALLAWSLAHGAVDVGRWGGALRPGFDAEALAADVGREVRHLALERRCVRAGSPRPAPG